MKPIKDFSSSNTSNIRQKLTVLLLVTAFIILSCLSWIIPEIGKEKIIVPGVAGITKNDIELYREYKEDYDKKVLMNADPKKIARIYIYSMYMVDVETMFRLSGSKSLSAHLDPNYMSIINEMIESIKLLDVIYIDDFNAEINFRCIYKGEERTSKLLMKKKSENDPWKRVYGWFYEILIL